MSEKEYIEREAALKILENSLTFSEIELDIGDFRKGCIAAIQDDISNIKHIPTADVAPRAEVAREIFEEIERLKEEANKYPCRVRMNENSIVRTKSLEDYDRLLGDISAEAIKEFAQRLKSDLGRIPQHQFTRSQVEWSINTFVKEMTEEQTNESQST